MVRLASPGPPWVRTRGSAKIWNELIVLMTTRKKMVGDSIGNVMRQKRVQALAPSTIAASLSCSGIDWSPAMYTRIENPIVFHELTTITDTGAKADEPSQSIR